MASEIAQNAHMDELSRVASQGILRTEATDSVRADKLNISSSIFQTIGKLEQCPSMVRSTFPQGPTWNGFEEGAVKDMEECDMALGCLREPPGVR